MTVGKIFLPIILFIFLVFEGVSLKLLPEYFLTGQITIVSHWVLATIVLSVLINEENKSYFLVWIAAIFGLLIDVVYTDLLGVYMFSYASVTYLTYEIKRHVDEHYITIVIIGFLIISLADLLIYVIYLLVDKVVISWKVYLVKRMLPTALSNLVFLTIIYFVLGKKLKEWFLREIKELF